MNEPRYYLPTHSELVPYGNIYDEMPAPFESPLGSLYDDLAPRTEFDSPPAENFYDPSGTQNPARMNRPTLIAPAPADYPAMNDR
jgi:hypothetical protein